MICALLFLVDVCAFLNELILNEAIVFFAIYQDERKDEILE